jgi:hypothetical protein
VLAPPGSAIANDDGLVPGEEQAVRAWLKEQGFEEGDLRSPKSYFHMHPMGYACGKGELNVCKWLHNHGAAPDISTENWLGMTPMFIACQEGHLSVCKWLFEVGAAADITKAASYGFIPMWCACMEGHLSVCKWLFEVGAAADITKVSNNGTTPMFMACEQGHLSVCKWLFEVGAAADITKANNVGETPMYIACQDGHLSVCKWLVFNGALNTPPPAEHDDGHVDQAIVKRDTRLGPQHRPALLTWAQDLAATHHIFLHVVLRASVVLPHRRMSPRRRCYLPMVPRCELERIGSFLDLEIGRRVRNVREFAAALMMAPGR